MGLFLDDNGLRYLWQKIKNMFVAKESGKGLSTNDFTAASKSKLDGIANNANNYSLPTASATTLGGIKVGSGLSIDNGVLSAATSSAKIDVVDISLSGIEMTHTFSFPIKALLYSNTESIRQNYTEIDSVIVTKMLTPGDTGDFCIVNTSPWAGTSDTYGSITISDDGLSASIILDETVRNKSIKCLIFG